MLDPAFHSRNDSPRGSGETAGRRPALFAIAMAFVIVGASATSGARAAAPTAGVQDFREEAPADIFTGPLAIYGQVVHRALDGSWIKLQAQSRWGRYAFQIDRLGSERGELSRATDTPDMPAGAVAARETPWTKIQSSGSQSWLWLEGTITATRNGGSELEGRFAFSGEVVRLKFTLVENFPLGADPVPTFRNVYYGPNTRQKLDVYLAKSDRPTPVAVFIHGGAWQKGDKTSLIGHRSLLDAGITVIAIDYRYIPAENPGASIPAVAIPLGDAARAVQFIRSRASEWGIAKDRIAAWGASAGAFSALWLATHPDLADPSSPDPVLRESTRLVAAAGILAQTSLDPVEMRDWVGPELNYGAHAFAVVPKTAGGNRFQAFVDARERLLPWIRAYSPAALLDRGDAPIFLDYRDFSLVPNEPLGAFYTHSPGFGIGFLKRAQETGAECYLRYVGREDNRYRGWEHFIIGKLTK